MGGGEHHTSKTAGKSERKSAGIRMVPEQGGHEREWSANKAHSENVSRPTRKGSAKRMIPTGRPLYLKKWEAPR
jgi:hypothetical protein